MNLETCFQMLIKVNKYADSEFRISNFLICIFGVVYKLGKRSYIFNQIDIYE